MSVSSTHWGRTKKQVSGADIPKTIAEARPVLGERMEKLTSFIDIVAPPGASGPRLAVPDTSVLIDQPDLTRYPETLSMAVMDIYLVPAVLSELDNIKDQGRNAEVREKARMAGRAIRDLRSGGSLLDGVGALDGLRSSVALRSRISPASPAVSTQLFLTTGS